MRKNRLITNAPVTRMPKRQVSVLFSSAGRRVELIHCFRMDAAALGIKLRVFACDANPELSAACHSADDYFTVPGCREPGFIPTLLDICRRHEIDLLVPTIDTELETLARHRHEFRSSGTLVVVSSLDTVLVCRDKGQTAELLTRAGVSVPKTASLDDFQKNVTDLRFPIILKPVDGSSSTGIQRFETPAEFQNATLGTFNYLVQELRRGPEYTVNMFFDQDHRVRSVVPHRRLEVRAGEVSKGRTEGLETLMATGLKVASSLPRAFGPLCLQGILCEKTHALEVFEVNARFGGGYPLAWKAGATFSRWLLEWAAELPSSIHPRWQSGLTMLRYDSAIFVPAAN